jgi:hypothetical protein
MDEECIVWGSESLGIVGLSDLGNTRSRHRRSVSELQIGLYLANIVRIWTAFLLRWLFSISFIIYYQYLGIYGPVVSIFKCFVRV